MRRAAHTDFDLDHDEEPPTSLDGEKVAANTQANAATSQTYRAVQEQIARSASMQAPAPVRPGDSDEEDGAKHAEFNRKRNRHYGNEAQALKQAATLRDDDED